MNKKLAAALSGGAALLLTLTGCGDDTAKMNAWAERVCGHVKPQVQKIRSANSSITQVSQSQKSPEEVQKADAEAFQNISEAYESLADAIDKAGAPPVENGAKLQKDAVKELHELAGKYAGITKTVKDLETDDQAKFAAGLKGVAQDMKKFGKSGDQALRKLQSGELRKAMVKQPGCQKASPGVADAKGSDNKDS
ncbi:MAG TPA: small secreted protein [Streptomyces sp.]|nr:small secreted protein [Streptomyces sp.]